MNKTIDRLNQEPNDPKTGSYYTEDFFERRSTSEESLKQLAEVYLDDKGGEKINLTYADKKPRAIPWGMGSLILVFMFFIFFRAHFAKNMSARGVSVPMPRLLLSDFDSQTRQNALGGYLWAWKNNLADITQFCNVSFVDDPQRLNGVLKLNYDVDSSQKAMNGACLNLKNFDASQYKKLRFFIKGDERAGFTRRLLLRLGGAKGRGEYLLGNIASEWKEINLPLRSFRGMKDLTKLTEFGIIFEDSRVTSKRGTIYIDDISFD